MYKSFFIDFYSTLMRTRSVVILTVHHTFIELVKEKQQLLRQNSTDIDVLHSMHIRVIETFHSHSLQQICVYDFLETFLSLRSPCKEKFFFNWISLRVSFLTTDIFACCRIAKAFFVHSIFGKLQIIKQL